MKALSIALTFAFFAAGPAPASAGALLEVNGHLLKWGSQGSTSTTIITYAVLAGPYVLPGGRRILSPDNCSSMRAFGDIAAASPGVTAEAARRALQSAFAAWEAAANVKFLQVGDPLQANIVVGAQDNPAGRAFTNLSYIGDRGFLPVQKALGGPQPPVQQDEAEPSSVSGIEQSYVCLNRSSRWKAGFDGDLDVYDLRHTFMHEIGHAIGLDHPGSSGSVMAYRYDEGVRELQPSDIAAVQRLYGPPRHTR